MEMASERTDVHELPTPLSTLRARYVRVSLNCRSCLHQADADLEALVGAGRGAQDRHSSAVGL
jgi:hypothetical protein